jgi:glycosyltransferase
MKLSIITVVYNNEKTIADAIESVLNQSYKNIEYIIIDGNSSDHTLDIIRSYGASISKLVSESDKGIYDAMNKGISLATGEIIGILNSDDLYADVNVLKDVMNYFKSSPRTDILYGNLVYVKRNQIENIVRRWDSKPYFPSFYEKANVPPHPTLFLKSKVYELSGNFNLSYKLASDYEFMLRVFKKYNYNIVFINRLMILMRLGGATNKNFKNIINGNLEILRSWRENNLKIPFLFIPLRVYKKLLQYIK